MNNILKYDMDEDVSKSHTKKSDRKKTDTFNAFKLEALH